MCVFRRAEDKLIKTEWYNIYSLRKNKKSCMHLKQNIFIQLHIALFFYCIIG